MNMPKLTVTKPEERQAPSNFDSVFRSPRWVPVFNYVMGTGLTPYEVEDLVRSYMEHRRRDFGRQYDAPPEQMSFDDMKQGALL
jgi:hypothetical protein